MSESYVECLVKQKSNPVKQVLKYVFLVLTGVFVLTIPLLGILSILGVVICGVLSYFMVLGANVEYEYLYLDKEISVDRINNQAKRKNVGKYEVERMEILAPIHSVHMGSYKNRTLKELDYSIGCETQPEERYVMIYEGQLKIILSPSAAFVKAVKNVAPRKVFTD